MNEPLLQVENLSISFKSDHGGIFSAVNNINFNVYKGESIGIVGESGCGKSVTAMSIMRLLKEPPAIVSGKINFEGSDIRSFSRSKLRDLRGNEIAMIFQEPMTSLNPVYTCGKQISEAIIMHQKTSNAEARKKTIEILRMVGIPSPEQRADEYPHQLSGGMRQRIMIAMALSCHPKLLIADEPTTALDVTIQAQILELIKDLKNQLGMSMILITHDLGVVAEMTKRVIIMYAGEIVEEADVKAIFKNPGHPYTRGLLASIPRIEEKKDELYVIEGVVPSPSSMPRGCRFSPRCPECMDKCRIQEPPVVTIFEDHVARCWLLADAREKGGTGVEYK